MNSLFIKVFLFMSWIFVFHCISFSKTNYTVCFTGKKMDVYTIYDCQDVADTPFCCLISGLYLCHCNGKWNSIITIMIMVNKNTQCHVLKKFKNKTQFKRTQIKAKTGTYSWVNIHINISDNVTYWITLLYQPRASVFEIRKPCRRISTIFPQPYLKSTHPLCNIYYI